MKQVKVLQCSINSVLGNLHREKFPALRDLRRVKFSPPLIIIVSHGLYGLAPERLLKNNFSAFTAPKKAWKPWGEPDEVATVAHLSHSSFSHSDFTQCLRV